MYKTISIIIIILISDFSYGQDWAQIKASMSPTNEIPLEFDALYRQPLSTLGWEDGIHISKDGLNLYCTYVPIDFLAFALNGDLPNNFSASYLRGAPTFGMDLITNPIGASEWLHSDILHAHRNTITDSFNSWTLSNMARNFYSEGAPAPTFHNNADSVEFMMFTSIDNPTNNLDIWVINNTSSNPMGVGAPMPSPINTLHKEDNPHLVRTYSNNLVLFFDSNDLPGGIGDIDIWFSESSDNGISWSTPSNVSTINTVATEHQPFLHKNLIGNWYLYYSAPHTDGKLAIFRVQQMSPNDWDSWGIPELVLSAGSSAGIGEPTLTKNGDISFVVVYQDPINNSIYNRFDADPWFLQKRDSTTTGINSSYKKTLISIYPNPTNEIINIDSEEPITKIQLYNTLGELVLTTTDKTIQINHFPKGLYYLNIQLKSGEKEQLKLIKQ